MPNTVHRNYRTPVSKQDRNFVYARDGGICQLCFTPVPWFSFAVDHIKPVAHGGTSNVSNLQLAHASCNGKRGVKPLPNR